MGERVISNSGRVEIKYTEHIPDYLIHLHTVAAGDNADAYRDEMRIAFIKICDYDRAAFPPLKEVDNVYLVYKRQGVVL